MYSETITNLISQGAKAYSGKDFELAATSYADACAAYNEEHSVDDPDLLLLYGKALFQNGVSKSGVIGGVEAVGTSEKKEDEKTGENDSENEESSGFQFHEGVAEEIGGQEDGSGESDASEDEEDENQSNFQKEGEESDENDENDEPAEEQTDFEAAWDILDLTRALFEKLVEESPKNEIEALSEPYLASDDEEPKSKYVATVKKLSETYDLLGEVSLETENFPQAAADLESCLALLVKLYDAKTSPWVSESHYKLSLALEFCAEDPESRAKAASHVKSAINVVNTQIETKKDMDEAKKTEKKELLKDLEERYKELQKNPEQEVEAQQMDVIKGLLGEVSAGGPSAAQVLTEALQKKAAPVNDLSMMVKKRKAKPGNVEAKKAKKQ